jgi:hypothetical protein
MFYYIDVHLLAHYIQWIKMQGETVKIWYLENFLEKSVRNANNIYGNITKKNKIWKCVFILLLAAVIAPNLQKAKHHQDIIM